jgi:hypothetical protein
MLLLHRAGNVRLDGGPTAEPEPPLAAWLVTDPRVELIDQIRRLARTLDLEPAVGRTEPTGWQSSHTPLRTPTTRREDIS